MSTRRRHPASHALQPLEPRRLLAANTLLSSLSLKATESVDLGVTSLFVADDGKLGKELWRTDGTAGGTSLVKDLTPGAAGTEVIDMVQAGDRAIFIVKGPGAMDWTESVRNWQGDFEVWSSDGTSAGTVRLARFEDVSSVQDLEAFGSDKAAFGVLDVSPTDGPNLDGWLWSTDGTAAGTREVASFPGKTVWGTFAAGDRVVFSVNQQEVWSSDGTAAGLINLSAHMDSLLDGYAYIDFYSMKAVEGGVVMLSSGRGAVWFTDGTKAGTKLTRWESREHFDTSATAGGKFYFIGVTSAPNGQDIIKTLYVVDPIRGTQPLRLYRTGGDGSDNHFSLTSLGDRLVFTNTDHDSNQTETWVTDGTPEGTTLLNTVTDRREITLAAVEHGGLLYSVRLSDRLNANTLIYDQSHFIGGLQPNNVIGGTGTTDANYRVEFFRTDGTAKGTGVIRSIPVETLAGREVLFGVTVVNGQIALRTRISEGIPEDGVPWSSVNLNLVSDTTELYDPAELTIGREATSVRLTNGSLHIGGTNDAEDILVFRRRNNPDKLVVQIDGQQFDFKAEKVKRIKADLQGGNDRLEIRETTGGKIAARAEIMAGDGADKIYTASARDTVMGGAGTDRIVTRGNADVAIGGGGKDRIDTGAGQDFVNSGEGRDVVAPGADADLLFGQTRIESVMTSQIDANSAREDMLLY